MTAQDRPAEKSPAGTADAGRGPGDSDATGDSHASSDSHATGGSEPLLPDRAAEDTDAAWGEFSQRDDDRLYRDRPPHWDDF